MCRVVIFTYFIRHSLSSSGSAPALLPLAPAAVSPPVPPCRSSEPASLPPPADAEPSADGAVRTSDAGRVPDATESPETGRHGGTAPGQPTKTAQWSEERRQARVRGQPNTVVTVRTQHSALQQSTAQHTVTKHLHARVTTKYFRKYRKSGR